MKQFLGLLQREWLEHRASLLWGPAVLLGLMVLAGIALLAWEPSPDLVVNVQVQQTGEAAVTPVVPDDGGMLAWITTLLLGMQSASPAELGQQLSVLQRAVAQPFAVLFLLAATFILLSCLFDERKDGSVLFWKSLPVSDTRVVFSKLVFVMWIAPAVPLVGALCAQCLCLILFSLALPNEVIGAMWQASALWWQPLILGLDYLYFSTWILPLAAWLMLVSVWFNKTRALWAFGIPWVLVLLEEIFFASNVLADTFMRQLRGWSMIRAGDASFYSDLVGQWLLGMVTAIVLLVLTVHLRRRQNQL